MNNKIAIIAPHIDDELIGCWSVLKEGTTPIDIYWCISDGVNAVRTAEANNALVAYGKHRVVTGFFGPPEATKTSDNHPSRYSEVYVPATTDKHRNHKQVNARYRKYATHFYSTNLEGGDYLLDHQDKKQWLNSLYPSQKDLWAYNASFYLFEKIRETDIQVLRKYHFIKDGKVCTLVSPKVVDLSTLNYLATLEPKKSMDWLISQFGEATGIKLEIDGLTYKE